MTFAVGIPFINAWYEPSRRGFAAGVFGAGMGGTALSSFYPAVRHLVRLYRHPRGDCHNRFLVLTAMHDSPGWRRNTDSVLPKLVAAPGLPVTWTMSFPYAVALLASSVRPAGLGVLPGVGNGATYDERTTTTPSA